MDVPYERPPHPEIILNPEKEIKQEMLKKVLRLVKKYVN
jgi:adenylylsulfate kinase-like enzyme